MAKRIREQCGSCRHSCIWPQSLVPKEKPTHPDTSYCGRVAPLNEPLLEPTSLAGEPLAEAIFAWIHEQPWNEFAMLVGRVKTPCPGFEP